MSIFLQETQGLSNHIINAPPYGEINNGDIGVGRLVTNRNRHGRPHVADTHPQGLRPMLGMGRHPYDIIGILGALAQGRRQSMGAFVGFFSVIDFDQIFAHRVFQGCRSEVRVGELMCLGAGAKPHFGNVKSHDVTTGGQYRFHGRRRLMKETVMIERTTGLNGGECCKIVTIFDVVVAVVTPTGFSCGTNRSTSHTIFASLVAIGKKRWLLLLHERHGGKGAICTSNGPRQT
jgi:hypothetical protein